MVSAVEAGERVLVAQETIAEKKIKAAQIHFMGAYSYEIGATRGFDKCM